MSSNNQGFVSRLKQVMTWERCICRLIAAWTLYAALILYTTDGNFFDLAFAQDKSTAVKNRRKFTVTPAMETSRSSRR